jgi:L-alanine-DL-glutamate epimerase-like enolase superfamily enzyme
VTDPRALARRLATLPVRVSQLRCTSGRVALADYPGGRPCTLVALSGEGHTGFGENVAFSDGEQQAFVHGVEGMLERSAGPVGAVLRPGLKSHDRAALEGALIDLAMRQAGLSLRDLCGVEQAPLRWVHSFSAREDAAAYGRALGGELKVDVHPRWTDEAIAALAREAVAILDFKGEGSGESCARLSAALPSAIFEDPPAGCGHARVAHDRSLLSVRDVAVAVASGASVNLKAPRMGGVLAVLDALGLARGQAYFGGMFEAGPGREQARALAAIFCGDAPNDLAPLTGGMGSISGESPSVVRLDGVGFGGTCAWGEMVVG